jgi:hypothetical protein
MEQAKTSRPGFQKRVRHSTHFNPSGSRVNTVCEARYTSTTAMRNQFTCMGASTHVDALCPIGDEENKYASNSMMNDVLGKAYTLAL